jgi:sirohydrochlorin ferrochelatase
MNTLLLIAHGSRRAEANADLEHVATEIRHRGRFQFVQCSYLELTEPGILAGGDACVAAGATSVVLLPYFLSPGVHVREDLTEARDELSAKYPDVQFLLAEPLGRHPMLIDIVEQRSEEVSSLAN